VAKKVAVLLDAQLFDQPGEALCVAIPNRVGKSFDQFFVGRYLGDDLGEGGDVINGDGLAWGSAELQTLEHDLLATQPQADELPIGDFKDGKETLK